MPGLQHAQAVLDDITDRIVAAAAAGHAVEAGALRILLRRYASGARADVAEPLGDAFARAVDRQAREGPGDDPAAWLALFAEAASASDDRRLVDAAVPLVSLVKAHWAEPVVADALRSIESCLLAAAIPDGRAVIADAVDSLERVIGAAYRAGSGISHLVAQPAAHEFVRGDIRDHLAAASTLLTAHAISGRLPYAMLADELVQLIRRETADAVYSARCDAVRVHCRLARLHHDPDYLHAAVVAPGADHGADAARLLTALVEWPRPSTGGSDDVALGLALTEWLGLRLT